MGEGVGGIGLKLIEGGQESCLVWYNVILCKILELFLPVYSGKGCCCSSSSSCDRGKTNSTRPRTLSKVWHGWVL